MKKWKFRPDAKTIVVGASRDCFPVELCKRRLKAIGDAMAGYGLLIASTIIENRDSVAAAVQEVTESSAKIVVLFLANFSPEQEDARFIKAMNELGITVMIIAASEEGIEDLQVVEGKCNRGDALCGLLSANYTCTLGKLHFFIPARPVGTTKQLVKVIEHFMVVMSIVLSLKGARIGIIGGRPNDFPTCETREDVLRGFGAETHLLTLVDLQQAISQARGKTTSLVAEMRQELGPEGIGIATQELFEDMAAYELALRSLFEQHDLSAACGECWPRFDGTFGHVPCYVNSRMDGSGNPMICEGDGMGAFTALAVQAATNASTTTLDINHTIPPELIASVAVALGISYEECVGLFHCGRTPIEHLLRQIGGKACGICRQLIMERLQGSEITGGTLEAAIAPGPITIVRIHHSPADGLAQAYAAQGYFLEVDPCTFGGVGTAYIPGFLRFYRYGLLGRRFPHHCIVGFSHCAEALFDAFTIMGIPWDRIEYNRALGNPYEGENPWSNPALVAQCSPQVIAAQ